MSEYKDGELVKKEMEAQNHIPTKKELDVINNTFERFTDMRVERDKTRREFDGRTITEYSEDCTDLYNGIISDEVKNSKEDWQSLIWDHETRGKVKTVVSMTVGARPFISFIGELEEDNEYASEMFDVYEDSWKRENGAYQLYLQALDATIKGTCIVEEMYVEEKYTEKTIISTNSETGQVKFKETQKIRGGVGHVKSEIIPLLDFYPNENSYEIEHDCCTVKHYSKKSFKNKFGKFPLAEQVHSGVWADSFEGCNYKAIATKKDELVEVLRYYNEDFDEFIILANGIWLNQQDNQGISPIPFEHKHLPFAKLIFEVADVKSFYGKAMPDLLSGEQETRNALLRLMIDQEILATNKPILTGGGVEIDSYELYPGKQMTFSGDIGQVKELGISGTNQSAFQLLNLLRTSADINTSIGPDSQGVHSGRKTAREAVILDENAKMITSTFQLFVYKLILDRAILRIENIKQFYTSKVDGKQRQIPVSKPGKAITWRKINPELKGVTLRIELVEDFEVSMNRSTRVELSKAVLDEAKANPLINADEATIDYLVDLRKNPDRLYKQPTQEAIDFQNGNTVPPVNQPNQQQ